MVGPLAAGLPSPVAPAGPGLVRGVCDVVGLYWLQTLGCPKNQVDSDKLEGYLAAQGYGRAPDAETADLVVVNTCAFIDAARQESIDTVLTLADQPPPGRPPGRDRLHGRALRRRAARRPARGRPRGRLRRRAHRAPRRSGRRSRPGHPHGRRPRARTPAPATNGFDLLELPRPAARAPWAYVKVAEGCDRICGFCAIPSFRGKQRSRSIEDVLAEVDALRCDRPTARHALREIVLVAQDLASYGRDRSGPGRRTRIAHGPSPIAALTRAVSARVERTRLLYLYPSGLTDELIETVLATGVPYFDLSLQHVSRPLLARMRRWGDGDRFLRRIADIRARRPRRHLPLLVHPRLPGRDRARPRPPARVPRRRRSSTGPASSRSPARTAPTPPDSTSRCRPSSRSSACASAPNCRTPSRRPSATR